MRTDRNCIHQVEREDSWGAKAAVRHKQKRNKKRQLSKRLWDLFSCVWEKCNKWAYRTILRLKSEVDFLCVMKIRSDICSQQDPPSSTPVAFLVTWTLLLSCLGTRRHPQGQGRLLVCHCSWWQINHMHMLMVRGTQEYTDLDSRGDSRNCEDSGGVWERRK